MPELETLDRLMGQLADEGRISELASLQEALLKRCDELESLMWYLYRTAA